MTGVKSTTDRAAAAQRPRTVVLPSRPLVADTRDEWPLVGRDDEMEVIAQTLSRTTSGVVLDGAAGAGKTRLARAAVSIAAELGRPVRWVTALAATRHIPLGAMSHLLHHAAPSSERFELLRQAVAALSGPHEGGPLVLAIDDAHLLDELSAAVAHQVAVSGSACVVFTVCDGEIPVSLATLPKDGLAVRLPVRELTRDEVEHLVRRVLGGDLEARTAERLWRLTRGTPQFLNELVSDGLRSGRLQRADGLWWWDGPIEPSPWLIDLVLDRITAAEPGHRAVLEALATAQPLRLDQLTGLVRSDAVVALERRGVVTVDQGVVRLAQPIYGPVVRARMPESEAHRLRARIVRLAEQARGGLGQDDLLRLGELRLSSGATEGDGALLGEAAQAAHLRLDHAAAERLARAAIHSGAGVETRLVLIEAVQWQGRVAEAEELARAADPHASTDLVSTRLGTLRAINLFCGLHRFEDAERLLSATAERVGPGTARCAPVAARALLALLSGRPGRAIELGEDALRHAGPDARPVAAAAVAGGLALRGRSGEALRTVRAGWAALDQDHPGGGAMLARTQLAQAEVLALMLAGQLHELDLRTRELHARSMSGPPGVGDAVAALHRGWACLAAGRVVEARRWLGDAGAGLHRSDPLGLLPLCVSQLGMTEALLGRPESARALITEVEGAGGAAFPIHGPALVLADAWVMAAEGCGAASGRAALAAAAAAADLDQPAVEILHLHEAARLGVPGEVAARVHELAGALEGPLPVLVDEHVRGMVANDGPALDRTADRFERIGTLLCAADAAAHAADAHDGTGDRRAASVSRARAQTLAETCDAAHTPALDGLIPPRLTSREDEVARMAAAGMNNQAIASGLVLSVRTVEAHLAKAYAKLGIVGRHELGTSLVPSPRSGGHDGRLRNGRRADRRLSSERRR